MPAEDVKLETPAQGEGIYLVQGDDIGELRYRPAFTGDVFRLQDGRNVALVQHPCAMRNGAQLAEKLLICRVLPYTQGIPADWSTGNFKRSFLPDLDGSNHTIEFVDLDVISRSELDAAERAAILSVRGVNLLVQRWIYHNSRVIIMTSTINAQTSGPYDEADLAGDACRELVDAGQDPQAAMLLVDDWLGSVPDGGTDDRRRMLTDPQQKSAVRSSLRRQVANWTS